MEDDVFEVVVTTVAKYRVPLDKLEDYAYDVAADAKHGEIARAIIADDQHLVLQGEISDVAEMIGHHIKVVRVKDGMVLAQKELNQS